MVSVMYKLVCRSAFAGIGFSILFANLPADASGLTPSSISEDAARQAATDLSQEFSSRRKVKRHAAYAKRHRYVRSHKRGRYAYRYRHVHRVAHGASRGGSTSLAGVVGPLAAKARQIAASCGSRVVSAVRAGGHSHHSTGHAVDLQGNPSCIYAMLRGWPGGVSTDYGSAPGGPHVHVSYAPGGREWGLRFAHRGGAARFAARSGGFSASARRAYAQAYTPRSVVRARHARRSIAPAIAPQFPNF
jgi:hypothetical protein